ncbi:ribosome biogenesis protein BMS1 homolog isoform X1 [Papaver somniferum]|uniref:ribosome biogenesis protein BMS1 homolog isoform X1 n=1 Tax=Papaver somniferum TaxID=3469 RepID=UPI000E6F7CF8|nr:ribosome biogenesis protein BMS1 homolog isoform X1 [Papaver somniferum]XP_026422362.1 ribosome biogenesis protein BMS1 homolog isoform X1 [Papaver somniferum]
MQEVIGVLTYLDELKYAARKKWIMEDFRANIHEGANIFCLSFLHGMYQKDEIDDLANFLSVMEFHTLSRRAAHPYFLVDHFEDVTSPADVDMDIKCKRDIILFCYIRGCDIKKGTKVHIAGVGDYPLADITLPADPIPLQPVDGNDKQMQINIEEPHLEIESFRRGTYLRFGVLGVPFEMVTNYNPCQPILVGSISRAEDNVGHMQVRLMQHSWHMNMLKTKDPIIVSVGWRRYQTTPIYYQVSYRRHKMLEFTPVGEPCLATFWGPLAPPGARVVAVRSLADNKIVERIKRIGTPCLILNETALIKDMFTSDDEVNRFRDVKINTAHGIRGKINEAAAKSELPIRL